MKQPTAMGQYAHWLVQIDQQDIVWLGLARKDKPVNSLNQAVMEELEQILDMLGQHSSTKALVIYSAKAKGFIAGADIEQFMQLADEQAALAVIQQGQGVFNKLQALPMRTIAMIEGFCLGGGLELVLACDYRIAQDMPATRLGLPEVKLGIHPGWGGTIRLPTLIGAIAAMDLILSGRTLSAKEACKKGLVDAAVPKRLLEKVVLDFANAPPKKVMWWQKWQPQWSNLAGIRWLLGKVFYYQLQKKIKAEHYPAPFQVLENWVHYGVNVPQAQLIEAQSIAQLLFTSTSKNLVQVFFLQENLKSLSKAMPSKVQRVHVVGAGVMGGDIAAWCALRGCQVTLQDQVPELMAKAMQRAHQLAVKKLKQPHLITQMMDRLMADPQGLGIAQADVIIEAITEKLSAKQSLFQALETQAKPDAILATNTSTLPLEEIRVGLQQPQRLVGIHFFNPVAKMPLVEVVYSPDTLAPIVKQASAFVGQIDKLPLLVKSAPGFLVNRILLPYMLEAVILLEEGIPTEAIDRVATRFGMPMGPIELADVVGLDACLAAIEQIAQPLEISIPERLRTLVAKGQLGRKTGQGFYAYKKGKAIKPRPANLDALPEDIIARLTLRMLNEAAACLRERVVESDTCLDAGTIFGFGFPPFRGGILQYAKAQGQSNILHQLEDLATRYGKRFTPDAAWQTDFI
jgi:3-hydroxyacyl-CoA dehydrogenase/enoyl-CoA hydratase/3-hydroxybutyryl-CoA epimerase